MTPAHSSPPVHFSMLRNFHLADVVTLANATLGTGAILVALTYMQDAASWRFMAAAGLLALALLADVLDGTVARRRGRSSVMGRQLDSLADVISFGVAPAVLGFAAGLNTALDALMLVWLVACGVSRLARFNVTAEGLSGPTGKVRYFEGTPITFSLLLVAFLGWCVAGGSMGDALPMGVWGHGPLAFHPVALLYALSGAAMISRTLRIPKP
jgi:CDP-diacylglycerol--serine O-phosphatidyltransferase